MARAYYTVLGSLPHLPHFQQAERLPLSRLKLEQRLSMLGDEEARQLYLAEDLVSLRRAVAGQRSNEDMTALFSRALREIVQPQLRDYVVYRTDQMTVLAALRLRRDGWEPGKGRSSGWGLGIRVRHIERHWKEPDFALAPAFPWIPEVRELLQGGDAQGLERLLLEVNWRKLGRIADQQPLGFGGIVAFLFRWDILNAWLVRNAVRATERFKELMGGVKNGQ